MTLAGEKKEEFSRQKLHSFTSLNKLKEENNLAKRIYTSETSKPH